MKFICFAQEIPAIIGSKKAHNRQPRKYTGWLATVFMYLFTKKAK